MKKIIVAIFAHPDDEAFGPSGYLVDQVHSGADLHLLTLTLGQHGENPDTVPDLGATREQEWLESGRLMGATSQHQLGFVDGNLDNQTMLIAAQKIEHIVHEILTSYDDSVRIEFLTNDFNGITGHIDHIVAARAAALVFFRQYNQDVRYTRFRQACIPRHAMPSVSTDWLFVEPGRQTAEISETVDTTAYQKQIIDIIRAHKSQRTDGEMHIRIQGDRLGIYSFIDIPRL